ncbi:MAG: hypothetical protein A3G76_07000 [Acidobacteria bacterium RIFCSPLOWO2_12_FULL_65_11]|nr:MAG: hypothetical protein A3H95_00985 [Acidobacteria bacterium RIFCSPLOWO2_02_FULL_64_15]OFW31706.1 MAG: hypothetical protein A3G76_07000 [Acidobacteria bacterium RIFCSPLOWO2_12_FULL_65_11]
MEALIQVDHGSRWLSLRDPVRIVEAWRPDQVADALRQTETSATSRGCHAVGFLRYEAGAAFALDVHPAGRAAPDLPLVWFALFDQAGIREVGRPAGAESYELGSLAPSIDRESFASRFQQIRRHIADGNTYQVNYTFGLRGDFRGEPRSLFADLVAAQRARYSAFIRFGRHAICSASPELFFRRDPDTVRLKPDTTKAAEAAEAASMWTLTTRPMKGTARRGRTTEEDAAEAERLRTSPKERAENVMVVDMMRNDLGRIAQAGSVEVPALFTLEAYPNVWQLTSTVTARTEARLDEIFAALFPSASVTGAPKIRTMQIIRSLEPGPRGIYTGAIGYLAPDGRAQFNVAIRTAVIDLHAGLLDFGVGSGIVWDSDREREYEECLLKGSILGRRPEPFELLETMRWTPGEGFFLLERHLDRLRDSARYFEFACVSDRVREIVDQCGRAASSVGRPLRVRLLLAEDGTARIEHAPLDLKEGAVSVRLATHPIDPSDPFLFHKTTNRGVYERARRPDCDDVLLWNPQREVTESTMANVVVEIDGRRVTPPIACGLLAGTLRAELLSKGEIVEGRVTIDDLLAAPRLWLINSVRGWCPVALVTGG